MKRRSEVTVLMPVYNAQAHVKEAVESVLNQTFKDFELLIIDDGSTDRSIEIIKSLNDPRINIHGLETNKGLVNALNVGLDLVDSKYIARADADDICLPNRLLRQVEFMEKNTDVGALGTGFNSLMPDGSIKPGGRFVEDHNSIRLKHLYIIQIIHGTSMLRTEVIKKNQLKFDPSFVHAEDYDFFDRLSSVSRIANIQDSLYLIRNHENRVSEKFAAIQKKNSNKVKLRIFKQIGIEASEQTLETFQWMMYQNYSWYNIERARSLSNLIDDLVLANNKSTYLPADFFRRELSVRLMHLCNFFAGSQPEFFQLLKLNRSLKSTDNLKLYLTVLVKSIRSRLS